MPSSIETVRLIYNKQLFRNAGLDPEQPPVTFADMERFAGKISQAGVGVNKYGFGLPKGDSQYSLQTGLEMSSTYSGTYLYNYRISRYDLSGYAPWLQMLLDMKAQGSLYPGETLLKRNSALRQFADGNIGMMYVTSKDYVKLQEYMPKDDWAVALPLNISSPKGCRSLDDDSTFSACCEQCRLQPRGSGKGLEIFAIEGVFDDFIQAGTGTAGG